jgi:ABC-type Zn uptake system ZnuABC Zn-binding protein ZnuA
VGLETQRQFHELANLMRAKDPSAIFLMETWSNEEYLETLRCKLHFISKLVVLSNNKDGGLALF